MKLSEAGYDIIKHFEGLKLDAYQCSAGVWTIGYGHTRNVKQGDTITEEQADRFLEQDVKATVKFVNLYVRVELTQQMFDALCSFVFNVGVGAFRNSTMLRLLNRGNYDKVLLEFGRWVNVNGKESNGLKMRRKMEAELFGSELL